MKRIDDRPLLVVLSVFLIAVILLCGLVMEYGWFRYSAPITVTSASVTVVTNDQVVMQSHMVNINTASVALLETLPNIGPVLAQRIVDYRTKNGLFATPNDLKSVEGIGEKILAEILPYITTES